VKIKRLSFRNVGPFGLDGICLDGFSSGLNVVCETNEFGKSTVLKALELVLFKPFSSADKQVKSLRTASVDDAPEGEIIFSSEVRQGTSMEGIGDDGQIASLLEEELGTLVGGDRARSYLSRVEDELAEILTRGGQEKKNGPLRRARDALEATQDELSEARRLRDQTRDLGTELTKVRADIERMDDDGSHAKDMVDLKAIRKAMAAAQSFSNALALVAAKHEQAKLTAERAAERQDEQITALVSYNETESLLANYAAAQAVKTAELQEKEAGFADRRQMVLDLEAELEAFSEVQQRRESRARHIQRLAILKTERQNFAAQLEQLTQMEDALAKLTEEMTSLPVITRADVETLRQTDNDLRQSHAALAALSTRLYLDLTAAGQGKVKLAGEALKSGAIELTGEAALIFEGIGALRSDESGAREITQKREAAQAEYEALLERFNVADITQASKVADQRQAIELERRRVISDMARLAPEGRGALEMHLATAEREAQDLNDALGEGGAEEVPAENTDVLDRLRAARAQLKVAEETLIQARQSFAKAQTEQVRLREKLKGLNVPATDEMRRAKADVFASEKLKADLDLRAAATEVETLKSRAPTESYELLKARLIRLEQVSKQAQEGLESLKTKAAVLQARRDAAFEQGDAQSVVSALEARLTKEETELARQVREKDVRLLLRDTLSETQKRLKETYTAPVTQELAPLLSRVIPGAEAGLDDQLGVDRVQRNGLTEAITQVSGGTQEQFAILTRLAYARLLARSGSSVPVILDDALVYADDGRREAMFDVLGLVSSGETPIQIIYLSCHAGATARLGGTRITPQPWSI